MEKCFLGLRKKAASFCLPYGFLIMVQPRSLQYAGRLLSQSIVDKKKKETTPNIIKQYE